mgnify:CR=1 FL=1
MDKEENPLEVFNELRKRGVEIFVSKVKSPEDVPDMLRLLGEKTNCEQKGEEFATAIEHELELKTERSGPKVAAMIWHDPLMCVSPTRYSGSLLERCGFVVPDFEPTTTSALLKSDGIELSIWSGSVESSVVNNFL